MLLESILREDRSVLDLLNADYTFVDEPLAKHYGIPNVRGSRFRRVTLTDDNPPWTAGPGKLSAGDLGRDPHLAGGARQVDSGKYSGHSSSSASANVPSLPENEGAQQPTSVRAKMEQHRKNPVCASCHKIMDPIGFSLENFDLIGKWRTTDGGSQIDASGQLVDGTKLDGPASLRQGSARAAPMCSSAP